ncbi:hypothetical protein [Mycobacterium avium]|nr:hypothetical protein [Mycobacterium avium]
MSTTPQFDEQRLTSAASLPDLICGRVSQFECLPVTGALDLGDFRIPPRWHLAAPGDEAEQPVRCIVTGHRLRGGWQACDTVAAFTFSGVVPLEVMVDNADCTLRDLGAAGVSSRAVVASTIPGVAGMRSAGYFTALGLRIWGQFTTYIADSRCLEMGRLIQHSLFVATQRRTQLRTDIRYLSDAIAKSFGDLVDGHH